jgi:hypothetical protein
MVKSLALLQIEDHLVIQQTTPNKSSPTIKAFKLVYVTLEVASASHSMKDVTLKGNFLNLFGNLIGKKTLIFSFKCNASRCSKVTKAKLSHNKTSICFWELLSSKPFSIQKQGDVKFSLFSFP